MCLYFVGKVAIQGAFHPKKEKKLSCRSLRVHLSKRQKKTGKLCQRKGEREKWVYPGDIFFSPWIFVLFIQIYFSILSLENWEEAKDNGNRIIKALESYFILLQSRYTIHIPKPTYIFTYVMLASYLLFFYISSYQKIMNDSPCVLARTLHTYMYEHLRLCDCYSWWSFVLRRSFSCFSYHFSFKDIL